MKISEAITMANTLKPSQYDEKTMIGWLNSLDQRIFLEIVMTHEGSEEVEMPNYSVTGGMDTELIVQEPYTDVYAYWLMAMIDFYNAEITRYVNSMSMFNAAYEAFSSAYNRHHMPLQPNYVKGVR